MYACFHMIASHLDLITGLYVLWIVIQCCPPSVGTRDSCKSHTGPQYLFTEKRIIMASPYRSPPIRITQLPLFSVTYDLLLIRLLPLASHRSTPLKSIFLCMASSQWVSKGCGVSTWMKVLLWFVTNGWKPGWEAGGRGGGESMTGFLEDSMLEMTLFYIFINEL